MNQRVLTEVNEGNEERAQPSLPSVTRQGFDLFVLEKDSCRPPGGLKWDPKVGLSRSVLRVDTAQGQNYPFPLDLRGAASPPLAAQSPGEDVSMD
jgi:hypothetical protein